MLNKDLFYCVKCWHVPCECKKVQYLTVEKKDSNFSKMINSCDAPKIKLANGTIICATFRQNFYGASYMDLYVRSSRGQHIASRSFVYKSKEEKKEKLCKALNELKLDILSYEAGLVAERVDNDVKKVIEFINIRYKQLEIKPL